MNCEVKNNLVGCRVVLETTTDVVIEGTVRSVGSFLILDKPLAIRPKVDLPSQYRIFAKDIVSGKK